MKEHGILFKPSMITAIKENRKTQTRRIIHPQPDCEQISEEEKIKLIKKARYQPGDKLYIKEGFALCSEIIGKHNGPIENVIFKLDNNIVGYTGKWTSPLFMPKKLARTWMIIKSVRVERVQDISEEDSLAEGIGKESLDYTEDGRCIMTAKNWFSILWDSINAKPKGRLVNGKIASYTSYSWEKDPDQPDTYRGKEWISYPNPWVYVYEFEVIK